jgi:hypothetical protein
MTLIKTIFGIMFLDENYLLNSKEFKFSNSLFERHFVLSIDCYYQVIVYNYWNVISDFAAL